MSEEKWNVFASTGKIMDYLKYREVLADKIFENGDINGNSQPQGNCDSGISCGRK